MTNLIYLTILLPFLGFVINGLFGKKIKSETVIGIIGSSAIGISFLISLLAFFELLALPADQRTIIVNLFNWISILSLNVGFAYQIDQLSIVMALIVTGVGFIIHIYSIGYMKNDAGFARFFAYLNLFIFAMMNLIMADNFVLMFLGWEGVGLCSYLLIGFWYDRKFEKSTTSDAAKKAFIVNRIGDFGFLLGIFLIYITFNSLNFSEVFARAGILSVPSYIFEFIAIFLFIGATGKSAQIPLFVWLPDAMAGPTPVSALIHAATMVTAGVYMVARCSIIFALAPSAMFVIALIGLLTAFFAATIGLVQNDIKKILAYSTVSQLGYMFLALGMGAFSAGIFHVMTHAFFKALLFLGAGSVIHGMHEEQNIQKYGGLKQYMPTTYKTFLVGGIAIAGIPPLSGFFSKDEILWHSYIGGGLFFWLIGVVTALMTAFYMFRLISLTFEGSPRYNLHHIHPHESPKVILLPLIVLAVLSAIGGFIGIPEIFSGTGGNLFSNWLSPIFSPALKIIAHYGNHSHFEEILLMIISVIGAVCSIFLARYIYLKNTKIADNASQQFKPVYRVLLNKYYVDEIYDYIIVNPIKKVSEVFLYRFTDAKIIDGFINKLASIVEDISTIIKKMQTGFVQSYAVLMVIGIIAALFWIIFQ